MKMKFYLRDKRILDLIKKNTSKDGQKKFFALLKRVSQGK